MVSSAAIEAFDARPTRIAGRNPDGRNQVGRVVAEKCAASTSTCAAFCRPFCRQEAAEWAAMGGRRRRQYSESPFHPLYRKSEKFRRAAHAFVRMFVVPRKSMHNVCEAESCLAVHRRNLRHTALPWLIRLAPSSFRWVSTGGSPGAFTDSVWCLW